MSVNRVLSTFAMSTVQLTIFIGKDTQQRLSFRLNCKNVSMQAEIIKSTLTDLKNYGLILYILRIPHVNYMHSRL